jgi:hypothetical protein
MACIECIWAKENKFLVNPDGQVWPCCYLANQGFKFKQNGKWNDPDLIARGVDDIVNPVMQEYWKHEDELNINNHSLDDILNHEWFTKTLPNSWTGNNPHRICVMMCDKNG